MPWLGKTKEGKELIWEQDFNRADGTHYTFIELPEGSIEKLTGRKVTHRSKPIDLSNNLKIIRS